MDFNSLINGLIIFVVLGFLGLIFLREFVKRWRIGLRLLSGDENLLTDSSITMKVVTDAPPGSVTVSQVPAIEIKEP